MATLSVRRLIVAAIIAQLKTITIANGYNTELSSNVVDWQTSNVNQANLPMVEVRDLSEESERRGRMDYAALTIEVISRMVDTVDSARNLMTDITEAMKVGPSYPSNVYLSELTEKPDFLPEQKDKKAVKFTITYEVKYRE